MDPRQKVLIIDDSRLSHQIIAARIEDLSIDVVSAFTAHEGLDKARSEQPDLILLDVNLPDASGFDVCEQLKQDPATLHVPVIFISSDEEIFNKVRAFDLGAADYVAKPFEPAELRARVRTALNTKALMDMLAHQAQIDGLTGLHNRGYFDQRLGQELAAARRYRRCIGLLMLDVDHFKSINDRLGHPRGDQVLRQLATLIRSTVRESDIACRYGGEELAVILTHTSCHDTFNAGVRLAEAVRGSAELTALAGRQVTVSIGAACVAADESKTAERLVREADEAMYRVKAEGRDGVSAAFEAKGVTAR
ncbi:MAG: diguanylate cyclase [Phycisphaeraceae bacterium]